MLAIRLLSLRYTYGLRRFKGPLLASFTDAWRLFYNYRARGKPYIDLHDRWGDVVRVGPNALSFRDPQAIRDIFGAGKNWVKVRTLRLCLLSVVSAKFLTDTASFKSDFYFVNAAVSKGKCAHTLFSSTDPTWHKKVRRAMNAFFTRTAVLDYEPFVESSIQVFTTELDRRFVDKDGSQGVIDFHTWLHYFAFDVISDLTYSKRHGFMSRAEDVHGILGWVDKFVRYGFVVSPFLVLAFIQLSGSNLYRQVRCLGWICSSGIILFLCGSKEGGGTGAAPSPAPFLHFSAFEIGTKRSLQKSTRTDEKTCLISSDEQDVSARSTLLSKKYWVSACLPCWQMARQRKANHLSLHPITYRAHVIPRV